MNWLGSVIRLRSARASRSSDIAQAASRAAHSRSKPAATGRWRRRDNRRGQVAETLPISALCAVLEGTYLGRRSAPASARSHRPSIFRRVTEATPSLFGSRPVAIRASAARNISHVEVVVRAAVEIDARFRGGFKC